MSLCYPNRSRPGTNLPTKGFYPGLEEHILPILKELGIDKPNLPMEEDVWEYTQSIVNVSKEDIKNEIIEYLDLLM